jgi:hypothetical protein
MAGIARTRVFGSALFEIAAASRTIARSPSLARWQDALVGLALVIHPGSERELIQYAYGPMMMS